MAYPAKYASCKSSRVSSVRRSWPQFGHKGKRNDAKSSGGLTRFGTLGYSASRIYDSDIFLKGAVAQLGERMTGSHEVRGSIPLGSTKISRFQSLSPPLYNDENLGLSLIVKVCGIPLFL